MNLFEGILKLNGFPIKKAKEALEEIQKIPEAKYQEYIFKAREEIVQYHKNNTPSYHEFIGKEPLQWEEIPIMKKAHLQRPLEERLSNGYNKNSIYINKTSGSSGTPFIFGKDKFCHALTWAEFIRSYGRIGIDFNTSLEARFYGIPLDYKGYSKERIKDYLSNRYRFPVFDLSEGKMEKILHSFRRKKFDYINGYTSSIVFFAKFLKERKLVLSKECPTLTHCILTSEILFDEDKQLLEKFLGVPIINEYGASEVGLIAITNPEDEFEVNTAALYVEIVDENDSVVPFGNSGRIIITALYNKAHPIIRYDIGDLGILATESTYKKAILEKLIGRTSDMAKLPSGKIVPGLTFYYITKTVITNDGNIKEFVIEQQSLNTFKIIYASTAEITTLEKKEIVKAAEKYLEPNLNLEFERVEVLRRSEAGKLKQFVSLVNPVSP